MDQKTQQSIDCTKVVLTGGKTVLLRELKMKHQNLALQAVGAKGKDNQMLTGSLMIQELIKILIVQIDGKTPKASELENLDEIFSYKQIQQLMGAVGKLMGGDDDLGELTTEFVTIGGQ